MEYTPAQLEAIRSIDSNLQIIACTDSDRSQVISARIVEIIARGVSPDASARKLLTSRFRWIQATLLPLNWVKRT